MFVTVDRSLGVLTFVFGSSTNVIILSLSYEGKQKKRMVVFPSTTPKTRDTNNRIIQTEINMRKYPISISINNCVTFLNSCMIV